jgi:hypothetical protein
MPTRTVLLQATTFLGKLSKKNAFRKKMTHKDLAEHLAKLRGIVNPKNAPAAVKTEYLAAANFCHTMVETRNVYWLYPTASYKRSTPCSGTRRRRIGTLSSLSFWTSLRISRMTATPAITPRAQTRRWRTIRTGVLARLQTKRNRTHRKARRDTRRKANSATPTIASLSPAIAAKKRRLSSPTKVLADLHALRAARRHVAWKVAAMTTRAVIPATRQALP